MLWNYERGESSRRYFIVTYDNEIVSTVSIIMTITSWRLIAVTSFREEVDELVGKSGGL